ncbi:MAG: hypothetical protein AAF871_09140 [Pseudomonadota bacterium]
MTLETYSSAETEAILILCDRLAREGEELAILAEQTRCESRVLCERTRRNTQTSVQLVTDAG